ncbi:hypothetical protein, partial [Mesorhizobium sp.]|uniref:hypothetical protein n=1 Tax=Mesorhizobium sp. TaxID=1871066 RepID=UPI0025BC937F
LASGFAIADLHHAVGHDRTPEHIDETFKLDPGTGKRPEVGLGRDGRTAISPRGKDAEEDHHTPRAESVGKPSQKAANMQAQTYRWAI